MPPKTAVWLDRGRVEWASRGPFCSFSAQNEMLSALFWGFFHPTQVSDGRYFHFFFWSRAVEVMGLEYLTGVWWRARYARLEGPRAPWGD